MANTKKATARKTKNKQNAGYAISIDKKFVRKWVQIICLELPVCVLLIYFLIHGLFFKTFKCNASENIKYCQCVQLAMSEDVSLWGKINFIIMNPSVEDMHKYVPFKISAKCRIQTIEFIKSVQEYGEKTKENLGKAKDKMKNIFDKD